MEFIEQPRHHTFKDRTGNEFDRITVIGYAGKSNNRGYWFCNCSCDKDNETRKVIKICINDLLVGDTKSCGCLKKEKPGNTKHNKCYSKEYRAWKHAKERCYNPNNAKYKDYGKRGIKMCEEWINSPEKFLEDMGPCPNITGVRFSIDRKDVNGNYCKENCRWATDKEQGDNKQNSIKIEFNGKIQTLNQWSKETGLSKACIKERLKRGWTIEKALTQKLIVNQYSKGSNDTNK